MVTGLLGILKSGAAYVPMDPAYPAERLRYILEDSGPAILLTQKGLPVSVPELVPGLTVLDLAASAPVWQSESCADLKSAGEKRNSGHLAYVIYTSGSTGMAKGVTVAHENVARLFAATADWFHFNPSDTWTLFHSCAFDFSVWEIWGALLYGGRLIVVSQEKARSPEDFYELVCRHQVTVLNQTPGAFRQLIAAQGHSQERHALRQVIFGGEALEPATLKPWYERSQNQGTQLTNMYGITETTVHVTYRPIEMADVERRGASPIGRRIPDLKTYILDQQQQLVPAGVTGELYIGGAGVARGYLKRPELTAERFVANPFAEEAGARMYKTGDLGRRLRDGTIEYLGRNDDQVKIRGYRIELGEIEARMAGHPQVREAVVIAREDVPGERRLVAYYTTHGDRDESGGTPALRTHLAEALPEYMVPVAYVWMESLPLTPNGKVDRKALAKPEGDAYGKRQFEPPIGEIEVLLAEIWADLLHLEKVGRQDNFFELGGHSLLGMGVVERMKRRGLHANVRALFMAPTLAELAAAVTARTQTEVPENRIPEPGKRKFESGKIIELSI